MALTSPDESDAVGGGVVRRNRVALAMEHVAKYIPITDQRSFLKDEHDDDDDHADHDNYQCDDDKNKNKNKLMHNDIKNGIEHENRDRAQERKMKRQWLTVQDFCNSNSDSSSSTGTCTGTSQLLDQVLDRGRLLLSCQESTFDVCNSTGDGDLQNEYDREMSMLSKLDASVSTSTSGPPDEKSRARGSSTRTSTSMQKFMNERVDLQRNILAKRLGLGGILSSSMVTGTGLLNDMVSNEDLVDLPPVTGTVTVTPSSTKTRDDNDNIDQDKKRSAREINLERMKKRQKLERDKNENDKDDENKEDGQDSTIRRILLLSMDHDRASHTRARSRTRTSRINSNSTRLISHKTPQTILATDLIFHSFHPSWHIRHGSLLGLLALLRAWRVSYSLQTRDKVVGGGCGGSSASSQFVFGKWPQDILARCICVIALDRFGDYAGPSNISPDGMDEKETRLRPSTVAPVRDVAAQVISLLLEMAPLEQVQKPCFQILQNLFMRDLSWEIRHGAMLSFKYISGLRDSHGVPTFSKFDDHVWRLVLGLIKVGMEDGSDDIKGASAQTASSLISSTHKSHNGKEVALIRPFVSQFAEHLWSALCTVQVTSSCALDLLQCLCDLVLYDCELVLAAVGFSSLRSSPIEELLIKLGNFLEFHFISIRVYCLRALSIILEPLTSAVLGDLLGNGDNSKSQKSTSIEGLLKVYCQLVSKMFELLLTDAFDVDQQLCISKDSIEADENPYEMLYKSERTATWASLLKSVHQILSSNTGADQQALGTAIRETILDILFRYLNIRMHSNQTRKWTYKIDSKIDQYNGQVCAAEAIADLCTCVFPEIRGIDQYLIITITSLLESPWIEHCELSCILVQSIASSGRHAKFSNVLEKCQTSLGALLEQNSICLQMNNIPNIDSIRNDGTVKDICERALVTVLRKVGKEQLVDNENGKSSILRIWSDVYKKYGIDLSNAERSHPISASMASMRLNAAIGGAIACLGSSRLPNKLTPVVRSLVTLIKNENNLHRSRVCCEYLAELIRSLRVSSDGKHKKVLNKVLANMCALATAQKDVGKGFTVKGSEQSKMIIRLVVSQLPKELTLNDIEPFWDRLEPLAISDPARYNRTVVAEALTMICAVSPALQKNSNSLSHASSSLLPTVSLLACKSPTAQMRQDAVRAIKDFCQVDIDLSLPLVLPYLKKFMEAVDDDPSRLGSCTLLNAIVRSQGVSLCPYIPYLLPLSMSAMTDSLRSAAETSASTFSHLVRLAPLVKLGKDGVRGGAASKTLPYEWEDDCSKEVVEHLILGKPLPKCEIPVNIESSLKESGLTLRKYQTEGISWMNFLRATRLNGALCDDMGLVSKRLLTSGILDLSAY